MRPLLLAALLMAACTPAEEDSDWPAGLAPLEPLSSDQCPDLLEPGPMRFVSDGVERTVHVYFPEHDYEGAPVIFMWHPLGANANMVAAIMRAQTMAEQLGVIFVLPQALAAEPYEWAFYDDWGGHDSVLYDDMRTCLVERMGADPTRITSTGVSAGGLWTTWLTMHRADTFATTLVMSGGTGQVVYYTEPAEDIPVLVMWGGEIDTFTLGSRTVDFNAQSIQFSERLQEDGHFVVECNHGEGHTIPLDGIGAIPAWLTAHAWGEPSPFEDGDLSELPDYCVIAEKPGGGTD